MHSVLYFYIEELSNLYIDGVNNIQSCFTALSKCSIDFKIYYYDMIVWSYYTLQKTPTT